MDEYRLNSGKRRLQEIKAHAVALAMLGLSLVALYTHALYLAIIPLLWMAFRAGKEQGRDEAHKDIEQAQALATLIQFTDEPTDTMRAEVSSNVAQVLRR